VSLLEHRQGIKDKLHTILADDSDILGGELPLAHGIIHSLRHRWREGPFRAVEDDPIGRSSSIAAKVSSSNFSIACRRC
jgi:hypothetical protein